MKNYKLILSLLLSGAIILHSNAALAVLPKTSLFPQDSPNGLHILPNWSMLTNIKEKAKTLYKNHFKKIITGGAISLVVLSSIITAKYLGSKKPLAQTISFLKKNKGLTFFKIIPILIGIPALIWLTQLLIKNYKKPIIIRNREKEICKNFTKTSKNPAKCDIFCWLQRGENNKKCSDLAKLKDTNKKSYQHTLNMSLLSERIGIMHRNKKEIPQLPKSLCNNIVSYLDRKSSQEVLYKVMKNKKLHT